MTDEALMGRVRNGDREALGELFRRHQRPLYNFFMRSFGLVDEAEDLAMETLLRVFRHADHFRGTGSFKAWLYHLALNVARDRSRRVKRRPETLASAMEETWADIQDERPHQAPESMAIRDDFAVMVRAAVRELPEKERAALLLREYQQLSYEEISQSLRTTVPAVKMLLHRARGRVRRALEGSAALELMEVCL
jgi:RNA polymerase sigma-70 factor (ECF subfamily)